MPGKKKYYKKECYNPNKNFRGHTKELARFAKALAHPARIKILNFLNHADFCYTGDFVEVLPMAQSTVSQHLKELKDAGLIIANEKPPRVSYCINKEVWEQAKSLFYNFFDIELSQTDEDE